MASITLKVPDRFPAGTLVTAYPRSNWGGWPNSFIGAAPLGSSTTTATADSTGAVAFTGLTDNTDYVAYALVSSQHRYVEFSVRSNPARTIDTSGGASGNVVTYDGTSLSLAPVDLTVLTGSQLDAARVARNESATAPYTVYVDQAAGSDNNNGKSAGQAFASLAKAVNTLQQAGHGGRVVIVPQSGGAILVSAPIHICRGIMIDALAPSGATIRRNFDTTASRTFWDAVTTVSGTAVTSSSATAAFVNGDANKILAVYGAGVGGGWFYDFIASRDSATQVSVTAATTYARSVASTDPKGVKAQVVGDWNRVVTDAGITSGQSIVTSATAAFVQSDVGTEIVIAGAGQGGQALRTVIKTVTNATTATVAGVSSATVSNKRCAIGVNFGDLITFHGPSAGAGGLRNIELDDQSSSAGRIGALLRVTADDGGSGSQPSPSDLSFEHLRFTNGDAAGGVEHDLVIDGSWQQATAGPGCRRLTLTGCKFFGVRRAAETIRIEGAVHCSFLGGGIVGESPTAIGQGIHIVDPQKTAGVQYSSVDINFAGFEGQSAYFYCEGQYVTYSGGRLGGQRAISGRRSIELSSTADHCSIRTANSTTLTGTNAEEYDAGTNNTIETQVTPRNRAFEASPPTLLRYETYSRRGAASPSSQTIGSTGVMILMGVWLPAGKSITRVGLLGGGTALNWGSGATGKHFQWGLYDVDGNLIGSTTDVTDGTATFSNSFATYALSAAVNVPRSGVNFIGLLINLGTSGTGQAFPTFGGMASSLAAMTPYLCGTSGSALTAVPSTITVPLASPSSIQLYGGAF